MTSAWWVNFYREHHWFMGPLLFVLVLGCYADLRPLFEQAQNLREQQTNLQRQLEEKEKALQQAGPLANKLQALRFAKNRKPLLDQVIQAAELNVCKLSSLQTEFKNNDRPTSDTQTKFLPTNRLLLNLHLNGDFFSFYHFLETLLAQSLPLRLDQFTLKAQNATMDLALQFSAYPKAFWTVDKLQQNPSLNQASCCSRDPFRESSEAAVFRQNDFQDFALDQLRYVGYLAQGGKTGALILLPDGRVYDIYPGSRLGKERGRVLRIDEQTLTLLDLRQKKLLRVRRA